VRRRVVVSVMDVQRVLGSCLISCFFLSNSHLPRTSFMVSLYCLYLLFGGRRGGGGL
jgi:hypothetical protein